MSLKQTQNLQKIDEYINDEHNIDKKFYYIERVFKAAEVRDSRTADRTVYGLSPVQLGPYDCCRVRGTLAEICACINFIKYKSSIKWSKDCRINNQNQNNPIPDSLK